MSHGGALKHLCEPSPQTILSNLLGYIHKKLMSSQYPEHQQADLSSKLVCIKIENLLGEFSAEIPLDSEDGITLIHGPNGCGKTTFFRMLEFLHKGNQFMLSRIPFEKISLIFSDGRRTEISREEKHLSPIELQAVANQLGGEYARAIVEKTYAPIVDGSFYGSASQTTEEIRVRFLRVKETDSAPITYIDWFDVQNCSAEIARRLGRKYLVNQAEFEKRRLDSVPAVRTARLSFDEAFAECGPGFVHEDHGWWEVAEQALFICEAVKVVWTKRVADSGVIRSSELIKRAWDIAVSAYYEEASRQDKKTPSALFAVKETDPVLEDQKIREEYAALVGAQKEFEMLGIIPEGDTSLNLPSEPMDVFQKRALPIFMESMREKHKTLESFGAKINFLLCFLNENVTSKKIILKNEKEGALSIVHTRTDRPLKLTDLSSGEQNLIVLLSAILFGNEESEIVLIDEPEISLHVAWQRSFLDALKEVSTLTQKKFLIATHSPQVVGKYLNCVVSFKSQWGLEVEV